MAQSPSLSSRNLGKGLLFYAWRLKTLRGQTALKISCLRRRLRRRRHPISFLGRESVCQLPIKKRTADYDASNAARSE